MHLSYFGPLSRNHNDMCQVRRWNHSWRQFHRWPNSGDYFLRHRRLGFPFPSLFGQFVNEILWLDRRDAYVFRSNSYLVSLLRIDPSGWSTILLDGKTDSHYYQLTCRVYWHLDFSQEVKSAGCFIRQWNQSWVYYQSDQYGHVQHRWFTWRRNWAFKVT